MTPVDVSLDEITGTLYASEKGAKVRASRPSESDDWLILELGAEGQVVGVQLTLALDLTEGGWLVHPERDHLPPSLRGALDAWYKGKPAGLVAAMDDRERLAELIANARGP